MQWVKAFVAGFLATLVFHQGLLALLHAAAVVPVSPYNWAPSAPLGVPAVLSLAFLATNVARRPTTNPTKSPPKGLVRKETLSSTDILALD